MTDRARFMAMLLVAVLASSLVESSSQRAISDTEVAHVKVQLKGVGDRVEIVQAVDGSYLFVLYLDNGESQQISPGEFADRVFAEQTQQGWWNRVLNVTSPIGIAWVVLGFLGQLLFTGRMLVQWLVSEKQGRSIVPPLFWWMSLGGASLLLVYFVWRKDIVGVIGQTTGWIIYLRNLWFIYRSPDGSLAAQS